MALRMEHAPTHHRTALPKRTSGAPTTNATVSKAASVPNNKAPPAPPRKKANREENTTLGDRNAASAAAGGGDGSGGGGGAAKGFAVAGERDARNGGESGCVGGSGGSGASGKYSAQRKRVRVVNDKLGEFVVMLQPYKGDHNDICEACDSGGDLLCCDFCNLVYHLRCVTPKLTELPNEELWLCPACTTEVTARQTNKRRRVEDGARAASPGPGSGRHQGQQQDKAPSFHGVKAENDAFRSLILYKNQTLDIGLFPSAQAAARAYDRKALSIFGDAAVCNFPADEQVEVEGIGADGNTVKGVVRSFHQWRAEMQWGNKKRHLGFFDRLDNASYAYNRAALYVNGSDTALNPTKEGYTPPPPTGAPVRVPRNKLFVQQLPPPVVALAQVEGVNLSFEHERRRQQMQGKYHSPLIGDNHQVSCLPPLPPPSRPWAGRPLTAPAAAPRKMHEVPLSSSSDKATLSSSQSSNDEDAKLCMSSPKLSTLDGGCDIDDLGSAPHRTLDKVDGFSGRDVVVEKRSERVEGEAEPEVVDGTSCSSLVWPPQRPPRLPLVSTNDTRQESKGAVGAKVDATASSEDASAVSDGTINTVRPVNLLVDNLLPDAAPPEKGATFAEDGSSRGQSGVPSIERGGASEGNVSSTNVGPAALLAPAIQRSDPGDVAIGAALERNATCPCPSAGTSAGATSPGPRWGQCSGTTGERSGNAKEFSAWLPLIIRGGESRDGRTGCTPNSTNPTWGDTLPARAASSLPPRPQPSPHADCLLMQISPPANFPLASPHSAAATGPVVVGRGVTAGTASAGRSPTSAVSLKMPATQSVAGQKRKLPLMTNAFSTPAQVAGSDGVGASFSAVCGSGNDSVRGINNNVAPDLYFDDVAELMWDPRAGPKPRFIPEAGGAAGARGEADRLALERAMWDRDSTLIERVAPAHAEKAMQVLQMHRHDVERAAQMLTVRHGIPVQGLSSVRTTRHSRAEQQAASNTARSGAPLPSGLAWRGVPSAAYGCGGGTSGGGSGSSAGTVAGWQSAAVATPRGVGAKKTDAQGITREEARLAGDAFMRYGRDLNAIAKVLDWKKSRVVEYYYCVWKFSPAYQVWKATRHQAGLPGVGSGSSSSGPSRALASGGVVGSGLMNATPDGMRWRGSRLRTLKTPSSQ